MSNTIINTNVSALNSHRALMNVGNRQSVSSERLSTGQRINRAADDAAGLSISEKMRSQIRGLDQASRNSQDGISLIQTAEGALQEVQDITQRMRELTVQAANDTLADEDRTAIRTEVENLVGELNSIIERTSFNGISLLNGGGFAVDPDVPPMIPDPDPDADPEDMIPNPDAGALQPNIPGGTINIQNGADSSQNLEIRLPNFGNHMEDAAGEVDLNNTSALRQLMNGYVDGADPDNNVASAANSLGSHEDATALLTRIDAALGEISTNRSNLGALQNRLEHTISNLNIASENTSAAESRIRDTDMAREMMQLTQANVLQQAATSMLAQANQAPQGVLQLLN